MLHSPKAGAEAAGYISALPVRKASFLITAGAKMTQCEDIGKKMCNFCHLLIIRYAETLKHPTMKAKLFGHLRITVYATMGELNVYLTQSALPTAL